MIVLRLNMSGGGGSSSRGFSRQAFSDQQP